MAGKSIRLRRAASEFNVGITTIVEFLEKKGHKVETNPNTKLTNDLYETLKAEFSTDKSVKEEASKRELSFIRRDVVSDEKKEEESPKDESPQVEEDASNLLFIKDSSIDNSASIPEADSAKVSDDKSEEVAADKTTEKPVVAEVSTEKPLVVEEKVVDEKSSKPVSKPKAEKEVVIEPIIEKEIIPEPTPKPEPVQEVIAEKIVEKTTEKATKKIETPQVLEKSKPKEEVEVKAKKVEAKKESKAKNDGEKKKTKESSKPEKTAVSQKTPPQKEEPAADSGSPRVVGHVDLEGINTRTRPVRKSKEEKRKEREDRKKKPAPTAKTTKQKEIKKSNKKDVSKTPQSAPKTEAPKTEAAKPVKKEAEFIKTTVEKLAGPKVVDKIDLSKFAPKPKEKRKPVASSSDKTANKKKKRKRIVKPATAGQGQGQQRSGQNQGGGGQGGSGKGKGNFRKDRRKPRKDIKKVDPTPEEIQKQIKETLNKLTNTKKSKGSKHRRDKRQLVSQKQEDDIKKTEAEKKVLKLTEFVTANEIASMMDIPVTSIISSCMSLGLFVSINQRLDAEAINLVADEFGYTVEFVSLDVVEAIDVDDDEEHNTTPRIPIVTVMGHVDHGKTKLLDHIRKENVVAGEAGGITQHIGAYEVTLPNGKKISFLDTPGHEAFTAMRARGAKITDIAIIVIAADDGVMPQTVEAISHAQAADVPIVFAINKIDRPTADAEKIKGELANMDILVEDWGGKFQSQDISAKEGINIEELLDKVLLEAEMLELNANPERLAKGTVLESRLDRGRGYVTNILVQNGTLRIGDMVLAGSHYGKVKAMYNERNKPILEAGPSTPALLLGLDGAPQAGDLFNIMKEDKEAKNLANKRKQLQREQGLRTQKHITLDEIGRRIAIGDFKELNLIVKGDVDGSIEALSDSLLKLSTEEVQVNVIHKSVGQISESDVLLASASDAIIIGFQVRPSMKARKLAETEEIDIRLYSIIYQAIDEVKASIEGMLAPEIQEKITCNIEIRETFKITKVGTIAGCMVLDGVITRNTRVRIIRDGVVIYTGNLGSLKRFKDDAKEVKSGYECGLNIYNFNDIKVGDIIEGFEQVEVKRTL